MIEHLVFSEETQDTPGPVIDFDCPACGQQRAKGLPNERMTRLWFLGLFPLISTNLAAKETWIACLQCGVLLGTEVKLADLAGKTPEELVGRIHFRTTFLQKALAVIALAVAIFPLVGFVMAIFAIAANWNTRTWPRMVSKIAVFLSILTLLIVPGIFVLATLEEWGFFGKP